MNMSAVGENKAKVSPYKTKAPSRYAEPLMK